MNKVLVLGSNSFAGSCLVDYLLSKNVLFTELVDQMREKLQNINTTKI